MLDAILGVVWRCRGGAVLGGGWRRRLRSGLASRVVRVWFLASLWETDQPVLGGRRPMRAAKSTKRLSVFSTYITILMSSCVA